MAERGRKPIPKTQRELSVSQHEPYVNPENGETAGNPNRAVELNRGEQVSFKGDTVKPFSLGFKEIDEALFYYMENIIKPTVQQNGVVQKVPVIYGSPEKWKQIQKDGYYRDSKGKIMMPLITFKRNSIEKNRSLTNKLDSNSPNNINVFTKSYSKNNAYNNFNILNNKIPQKEYYAVVVPDYVTITYDFIISTYYIEQLNKLIEAFNYASDSYWGDPEKFKFKAMIDSFATPVELVQGGERTVKATFSLKLHGYTVPLTTQKDLSSIKKFNNKTQTVFNVETSLGTSPLTPETYTPPPQNVDVYFNNILKYSPESGEDLFLILKNQDGDLITATFNGSEIIINQVGEDARVSNSDDSYDVDVVSGGDLEIPDEAITINSAAFITKPSKKDQDILLKDVSGTTITPVSLSGNTITILDAVVGGSKGLMPIQTGQTTSYATNDDGDLQRGRLTDFNTIPYNNPFGNTFRFTDELGGQTFTNNIVIDWSTWDGGSDVNGYCFSEYSNNTGAQVWDNWMLNSPYTCSTFGDWYLVNFQEMSSLLNMDETYGTDGYPFNITPITSNTMFTSTTYSANTSQVFRKPHNTGFLNVIARSGFYRAMLVRTFTISGTTLS